MNDMFTEKRMQTEQHVSGNPEYIFEARVCGIWRIIRHEKIIGRHTRESHHRPHLNSFRARHFVPWFHSELTYRLLEHQKLSNRNKIGQSTKTMQNQLRQGHETSGHAIVYTRIHIVCVLWECPR